MNLPGRTSGNEPIPETEPDAEHETTQDHSRDWPGGDYQTVEEAPDELAPDFDAEAHAAESAEHDKFLETYQPVITRLPEALQIEAEARAEEVKAERVQTLITDLGISEDEAREQVYGPSPDVEAEHKTE